MSIENLTLDEFLEQWKPSNHLQLATLPQYAFDLEAEHRLLGDGNPDAPIARALNVLGTKKVVTTDEETRRRFDFFHEGQAGWSADFRDRLSKSVLTCQKVDNFIQLMATTWIAPGSARQNSPEMLSIKASIQAHDKQYHAATAGKYVLTAVPDVIEPLFNPWEMRELFLLNSNMLSSVIDEYLRVLPLSIGSSINHQQVRRGLALPVKAHQTRIEKNYLSSFSLALGPSEQFSQISRRNQPLMQCMISAPIPAIQERLVAFAPFISQMPLDQMELVVAPPIEETPLLYSGEFEDIHEYRFE